MPTLAATKSQLELHLQHLGYEVVFRNDGWVECLTSRADERWFGLGATEHEALDAVLRKMLPSHLARTALSALRAEAAPERALPPATSLPDVSAPVERGPSEAPSSEDHARRCEGDLQGGASDVVAASESLEFELELRPEPPDATIAVEAPPALPDHAEEIATTDDAEPLPPPREEEVAPRQGRVSEGDDRCGRRHTRILNRHLAALQAEGPGALHKTRPTAPIRVEDATDTGADRKVTPSAHARLAARVRESHAGRRALLVSSRADSQIETDLEELFGLAITWCEGSHKRVRAQGTLIRKGSYDIVLCAPGFQDQAAVLALTRATTAARIPYVIVERRSPEACAEAVARAFGVHLPAPPRSASRSGRPARKAASIRPSARTLP